MKLYSSNLESLKIVLENISRNQIQEFETQQSLYFLLETIKFPAITRWKSEHGKNVYQPINYFPLVNWMLNHDILTKTKHPSGIVSYTVNLENLENLDLENLNPNY